MLKYITLSIKRILKIDFGTWNPPRVFGLKNAFNGSDVSREWNKKKTKLEIVTAILCASNVVPENNVNILRQMQHTMMTEKSAHHASLAVD